LQTAIAQTNRTAQFRLFPDIGTGHTLLLSRLYFRIAHTDASADRITLWAAGAYRNSQFHGALLPENGNNHRVEEYRNSLLRSRLKEDFAPIHQIAGDNILRQGVTSDGANAEDRIWIPSWQELGINGWNVPLELRGFDTNGNSDRAWLRMRSGLSVNWQVTVWEGTGIDWAGLPTNNFAVRPALHLSLRALLGV
ncbi:MAG: hypothetical protein FWE03_06280, partial [Firmicutes bacterium]|nr:hypothetical protein [Bacillota bacterium]